jgi:hypothetical protein
VIITLHCMARPQADFKGRLDCGEYLNWERELKGRPGEATPLPDDPGPGGPVLCASARAAVDYAGRLFKDRRIEVKPAFGDPLLRPPAWRLSLGPASWRFWSRAGFFSGWIASEESSEAVKVRMVQLATRLIGLAKEHDEAHFVGEPIMIRLLILKLSSIGWRGPLLSPVSYGHSYDFEYLSPPPAAA